MIRTIHKPTSYGVGLITIRLAESLEKRFLRPPHQPFEVRIFFCIVSRAGLFLDLSLGATSFFILFFQLLDPLSVAFGECGFSWFSDGCLLGVGRSIIKQSDP